MGTIPVGLVWMEKGIFSFSTTSLVIGGVMFGIGVPVIYRSVSLFASCGEGTPAPFFPTKKIVTQGLYRYVRNPMMVGVFFVLLGESVLFQANWLLGWSVFFMAANIVYIPLFEERELASRFGESYIKYRQNVPRWFPRFES
jgi:protein-S-isoprenylcysteine O-methyltransferase Ste14